MKKFLSVSLKRLLKTRTVRKFYFLCNPGCKREVIDQIRDVFYILHIHVCVKFHIHVQDEYVQEGIKWKQIDYFNNKGIYVAN
jgi:hypothetical protein